MEQKEALGRMMVEGFQKSDPAIVEGCLHRGADPDIAVTDGDTGPRRPVLHWAMLHFNEPGARLLLDYGANIEAREEKKGETALMFAINQGNTAAVTFLMKMGADPLAQDSGGRVALDMARGLRVDYEYYIKQRLEIIHALTADYGAASGDKPAAPAEAGQPGPEGSGAEGLQKDIQLLKTLDVHPHPDKGGKGLNL